MTNKIINALEKLKDETLDGIVKFGIEKSIECVREILDGTDEEKEYINANLLMEKLIEKYSDGEGATEYDRAINDALDIINNMIGGI